MKRSLRIASLFILSLAAVYIFAQLLSEKLLKKASFNGCVECHGEMDGFEQAHSPKNIGCESCHLGNSFTSNKDFAHKGMISIPGNLSNAAQTCGVTGCHPGIPERIHNSLMNTMSGVISVDRFAFNEIEKPVGLFEIKNLSQSNADNHLRNLCASCHLGNERTNFGPVDELSRGGGCNACHLNYSKEAIVQLKQYEKIKEKSKKINDPEIQMALPKIHPQLSLRITNDHCFGCHSRSGRISTNYEGWFETLLTAEAVRGKSNFRILMDGRVFQKTKEDVHHEKGLQCIDCHLTLEIMGDGISYEHLEEQIRIQCEDCHSKEVYSVSYNELDFESKKIVDLRNFNKTDVEFLITRKNNIPILNVFVNSSNQKFLITKSKKGKLQLKEPASICIEGKAHERLSCNSCHTEWVSHCSGCHTEYNPYEGGFDLLDNKDISGSWIETPSDFYVDYPVLGVREDKSGKETIDTFIPGMVVTINKMKDNSNRKIFKRLFAPTFSHTINKKGRTCESCHNNPLAIGYGKGKLIFSKKGTWKFEPYFTKHKEDNLPKDAWIGFLKTRDETSTTRINTRPFTIEEQKRILTVGACLTCHDDQSEVMKNSLIDFEVVLNNISSNCVLPVWN